MQIPEENSRRLLDLSFGGLALGLPLSTGSKCCGSEITNRAVRVLEILINSETRVLLSPTREGFS
ncbi:MAG: hypothetical protein LKI30_05055, partial [Bifidobacterium crudilactis]|nr:hypothetical protein [Bifidobacterium crudilactis]